MLDGLPLEAQIVLVGFLGLLVGSFLNVVIYRLPKMMEQQWAAECAELTGQVGEPTAEKLSLISPRSRCSNCGHMIAWYENIPVLSYIFLRGKCSVCDTPFGIRYPIVEVSTGFDNGITNSKGQATNRAFAAQEKITQYWYVLVPNQHMRAIRTA